MFVCDVEPEGVWEGGALFAKLCLSQRLSDRWQIISTPRLSACVHLYLLYVLFVIINISICLL